MLQNSSLPAVPGNQLVDVWPPPEFRATFLARYYLMDFGCSVHFTPSSRLHDGLVKPFTIGREQCAPEIRGSTKYDPFAADVYVVARVFHAFFAVRLSFHYGMFDFNRLSTARISFASFLASWNFCKTCHLLIPQVKYLLPWHLIGWKSCDLRHLRCCHKSGGLTNMSIVWFLEVSAVPCSRLFLLVNCGWPAASRGQAFRNCELSPC